MEPMPTTAALDLTALAPTRNLGLRLGRSAAPGDIILLTGPLGSGKTTLTQGIAAGLDVTETINSPTFTLLKEHYTGRIPLYHFDLYRLDDPDEIWSLGFEDYFTGDGLCVVEWAERAADAWADFSWLWLEFQVTGTTARHVEIRSQGERGRILMANCVLR